ncbi:hypothetical protein OYC64_012911 [Pagothenia borchgrevinki]|uniref:Uncharacterized protein n=2 Tax=Pagothenia borchgrevinki TaxID=8213 RepID=A0ABD2FRX8_PAGBO
MVVFRNEQDKSHADELVRLQSLTVKENEENEILKTVVEDLQKQLEESRMHILIPEDLATKKEGDVAEKIHKMVELVTASHQLELRESSETNIQNTRKLEDERLALSETNANITAELDSVRAHKQAGIEQLRQARNDFQDMVVFRNEQDKSHADELVRLQSLTVKENEENEILKTVVEDLQKQLEESRMHILIQEDLATKKEGDVAEKIHKMVELVTASHQLELRESSETNIQNTRKLEDERLALSETNANITAELDSVRAHKQAGIEQLRQARNDFQDMVVFRNEQVKSHADELVRLQSLTVKENEENEILKKVLEDLQEQLEESRMHILIQEDLATKKEGDVVQKMHEMVESVTASHQLELRESSETNIQNTRKLEDERLALSETNANITAELDSVRAHKQAGIEQLRQARNDFQDMVVFRNEQDKSHADELVRLQSLTVKENEENEILKKVVEDLQKQLEESRMHILIQEDLATKKEGDVVQKMHEMVESVTASHQLELRDSSETNIQNTRKLEDERLALSETNANITAELDSVRAHKQAGIEQLRQARNDFQDMVVFRNEQVKSHADELVRLQSLTVKENEENEILKKVLEDLQEQLEESRMHILIQEDLATKKEGDVVQKMHEMVESVTASHQLELRESSETNIQNTRKLEDERLALSETNANITAELDSVRAHKQAGIEQLRQTRNDFQDMVVFRNEQVKSHADELVRLQSLTVKENEENEILKKVVEDLQKQLEESRMHILIQEDLATKKEGDVVQKMHEMVESVTASHQLELRESSETNIQNTRKLEDERLALSETNANITAELDSVRAHKQAGIEQLRQARNDFQDMVVFRNEQVKSHADELVRLQSLTVKENEENEILKKVVEDLQKQLEESRMHILIQEDLATKKEGDVAEKIHKMVESVTASHQLELRESSETNIQNTRKLEDERLALSETNANITAELDSVRAHKQAGIEPLRQARNDFQDMVVFRNEQDKSHADELVRLQSLTVKENEENEILKKVVEDLQKQLEESRMHILIQEDLATKKEGDVVQKMHEMVESVTASHQLELRESSETNIQNTRKLEDERLALSETNANITAELDSVRAHKQAGIEQLRQARNDFQDMVVFRNEQVKSHADELVRLQSLTVKENEENEILKKVLEDLQEQLEESRMHILIQEDLATKKEGDVVQKMHEMVESVTASHQLELRESSETNIQNTRKLEDERLALSETNANITAELDSVRAHKQAGIEQLRQARNDFQDMVVFRNEQVKSHADELVRLQSLTVKENEENEILKKVVEDLQKQLEESRMHILIQEDLATKKEGDVAEKIHKMVESVTASHQLELRESSETNIQNTRKLEDERLALSETNANITAELDSVRAHKQAGIEQLRQARNDFQDMVVFRNEQVKSHADELVRLQSLTVKENEENEILKKVLEDLQEQLEESRMHILIQEDLATKKEGDVVQKMHEMVESVTASHQLELRESSETNIQNTRKLEDERLALSETNANITAELDSVRAHKQAGIEQLRQARNDFQDMVVFRNEQVKSHADELVRLQSLTVKENEENEILKKVVEDLQKQLEESRMHILIQEDLATKKEGDVVQKMHEMVESVTASHQLELRESSETNIQNTRKLEDERLALSETNANITAELDSVRAHKQAGIEQLRQARNDFQDMVVFRNEQVKSHADELVRLQSLTVKENEENEILKKVVEDLQKQLEESRMHILIQEDLATKKEGDVAEKIHKMVESVTASHQLELRESSETNIQNTRKLEDERLALSETNANITAELDSVRAHKQAGIEQLRQARNDFQDMVVFRNEQVKSHADELVRLQSLTVKENEENEILKKVLEDLQEQLEESRMHILIQEDLATKKEGDVVQKMHEMVESVTASHQLELRESSETNIQNTRKLEDERLALSETNANITAELDSVRAHKQAGIEQLRQARNDFQDMVVFRNEQVKSHADELVRLQSLTVKENEENEILKKVVEDLQKQLEESRMHILIQEDLATKKEGDVVQKMHEMVESVTASHQLELRESSETNIQNTRKLEDERLALSETNANITAELDSVRAHKQAGIEQLRQARNDFQDMVVFRNEQVKSHADELVRLQSLTVKENEENEILKKVVEDLQKQLEESRMHILIQEDLATKKEGDVAEKIHKMVESVTASHQLELRESSETNIQNTRKLEDERLALSETNANITAELDSVRAHKQAGIEQLRQARNDFQDMVVFRNEQVKSHADELVRLQSLTVKENEENEILKKVLEDLQEQLEESRMHILIQEDLATKKEGDVVQKMHEMVESVTASHQLELRESSETNIQNTRKLEDERLALSETNANITAELDSVRAHKQAGIEQLRQARNDFQDMVVFRNEQVKSHADELVRLQSLTVKENEENEILKKVVEDLQKQLEESRMHILIQEDLATKKEGDVAKKIHEMVELVTASHQLELRESSETNIQNTRKLEDERLALSETNANITAELDSVRAHKQAGIEQLRQARNDFQDMVVFRNEQVKSHADELVRLQSLTVKENEENEILKKVLEDLQEQLEESRMHILIQEDLATKKEGDVVQKMHEMVESVTASHQLELRESSETNIQNTRKLEDERLALSETNANITAELDSVRAHKQAGIEQLRQARNDFQDMVVFRNEQVKSHADELVRFQSLTVKENEENEILKKVVEDLQKQLEESRMHILIQEDLATKKEGDVAETIHEMVESVTASHQLELRESSETNIQNTRKLEDERLALSETNANITAELDSVRAHKQAGIEQLRQARNDFQDMVVFRNEQDKSHADELVRLQSLTVKENEENEILKKVVEDLQEQLEESRMQILIQEDLTTKKEGDIPESSLDEDETRSVWRYGSRGALRFALCVSALVTVTLGIIAASVDAFNPNCNDSEPSYLCSLLTSFCDITPEPF